MKKKLYLVATPIGNYDDITLRAINILKEADLVVCEELKPARRLLSHLNIEKELISVNEHNERETAPEVLAKLKDGNRVALISDAGTPLFSDPGHYLVKLCLNAKIEVVPVPGANSLVPALISSGLDIEKFYYCGWLSPKKDIRRKELFCLKKRNELIVLMETPYRLKQLLQDIVKILGQNIHLVLAFKLTMPEENIYRGTAKQILSIAEQKQLKGEFVLLVDNRIR